MRLFRRLVMVAVFASVLSCGPEVAVVGDEPIEVPPPQELGTSAFPGDADLGDVLPSGVDPLASRPPPPPFDR